LSIVESIAFLSFSSLSPCSRVNCGFSIVKLRVYQLAGDETDQREEGRRAKTGQRGNKNSEERWKDDNQTGNGVFDPV
jgi:hypothetical protein